MIRRRFASPDVHALCAVLHRQSADLVLAVSALQRQRRPMPACQVRRLAARRGIAA
ncbi:hypothetical protein [Massilia sp. X63]|uniref:hypothetical protein n=1 Tax=Massilia sp. X63 TaxID=3237285 RepID=UPI0034DD78B5